MGEQLLTREVCWPDAKKMSHTDVKARARDLGRDLLYCPLPAPYVHVARRASGWTHGLTDYAV